VRGVRIAVATVQVPFISGGAEVLAAGLVEALRRAGHAAELVTLPFRFFPDAEVDRAMRAWEAEDLTHLNLYEPDLVVCLKFPAYGLRHPRKSAWLLHQHRSAYDKRDADLSADERALAQRIREFDHRHLAAMRRFTISRRVSDRLRACSGLDSVALYHPPFAPEKFYGGDALPYVFFPSRFEAAKRQELLVRAMALVQSPVGAMLAGEGGQSGRLRELVGELGLASRVRMLGTVGWDEMRTLYARSLAVFFGPLDEDYGYVTLEAMLSRKPVITCTDSGGPLEFVVDGQTGRVVAPEPAAVAEAIDALWADRARARRMGEAGFERYGTLDIRWEHVVEQLTRAA
jgi:glycosyltransferase involved in cell wall biosynthesis